MIFVKHDSQNNLKQICLSGVSALLISLSLIYSAQADPLEVSADNQLLWDQTKGLYQADGNAVAIRGAQEIAADTLTAFYNDENQTQDITRILAERNVRFSDSELTGSGERLDYDIALDLYDLQGPKAVVNSKDGKARADKTLTFNRQKGMIYLRGNGEIALSDGRLLKGDEIDIALDEAEEIQTVSAKGNVFISQTDGRQANADEGVYETKTGKAILSGNVKIKDGDSILNGQKAEIDFNKGISRLLASDNGGRVSGILVDTQ